MTSDPGEKAPPRLPLSGATPPEPEQLPCPRCDSTNTKFCYYNNYNLSQPRHFCKSCRRYWTRGGSLRNVPVGGGSRKTPAHTPNKRLRTTSAAAATSASPLPSEPVPGVPVHVITGLKSETAPSCVDVNLNETAAHEGESSFAPFLNTGDFGFGMGSGFRSMDLGPVWQMEGVESGEGGSGSGDTWQMGGECFGWPDLAISSLGWGPPK